MREGDVTKRVNARDENEINNTGFGVNRYRCVHTPVLEVRGGYARIYFKFTILKNYMHRARAARACALAPRAKVGGMSQLWTIQALNSKSGSLAPWGIFSCFHRWVVGPVNRSITGEKL